MILAWLNRDLWAPMWPNMFAPSVITLAGLGLSHWRIRRRQDAHHAAMVKHVTERTR